MGKRRRMSFIVWKRCSLSLISEWWQREREREVRLEEGGKLLKEKIRGI